MRARDRRFSPNDQLSNRILQGDPISNLLHLPSFYGPNEVRIDLHSHIEKWLADETARPIAIWAGYGMGKTRYSKFLASVLAQRRCDDYGARIPMRLIGWSAMRATTSRRSASGSRPFILADYAARRTMPSGCGTTRRVAVPLFDTRTSSLSIRHSLGCHSASRKASRRSLGRKRVRLPRSYGLSFTKAASLSARWACR